MPPAPKRHCSIIVFDLNTKNKLKYVTVLKQLLWSRKLLENKDCTRLILLNSQKTLNKYDYKNISARSGTYFDEPNSLTDDLLSVENASGGNWLEALLVGIDYIKEEYTDNGVLTKQLVIISDFSSTCTDNTDIESIANQINNEDIHLIIVGPPIEPPFMIHNIKDIQKWMKELSFPEQISIEKLSKLVDKIVVCDKKYAVPIFNCFKNANIPQPFALPLKLMNSLKVKTSTVKTAEKQKDDVSLKQVSVATEQTFETLYEPKQTVHFSEVTSCFKKHDRLVPITNLERFQLIGDRCFDLIAFTDEFNVPEYLCVGDSSYTIHSDSKTLHTLIETAKELKMYGIAKRVYIKNTNPKYYFLVPHVDGNERCFKMAQLPYAEDIRHDYKETNIDNLKNEPIDENIEQYLSSLDITNSHCCLPKDLMPSMMQPLFKTDAINWCVEKYSDITVDLDGLKQPILEAINEPIDINNIDFFFKF